MRSNPSFPVRIRTQGIQLNEDLKRTIEFEAQGLERFNSRIVDCEVAIAGPARNRRNGLSFEIVVKVSLPGPDVVVHRSTVGSLSIAINQSFDTARRRVKRQAHMRRRRMPMGRTSGVGRLGRSRSRGGNRLVRA